MTRAAHPQTVVTRRCTITRALALNARPDAHSPLATQAHDSLGFDVSGHPDARSKVAQDMQARLSDPPPPLLDSRADVIPARQPFSAVDLSLDLKY